MSGNRSFIFTLWIALALAWLLSGEQFVDWAFDLRELGPVNDAVLTYAFRGEDLQTVLNIDDVFGAIRSTLHRWTGLG